MRSRDGSARHRPPRPPPSASAPRKDERDPHRTTGTWRPPAPGPLPEATGSISRTRAWRKTGSSRALRALTYRRRFSAAHLILNSVEEFHTCTARREIALDLSIPLAAIPLGKPVQECRLLLRGQTFNSTLNRRYVHVRIVARLDAKGRLYRAAPQHAGSALHALSRRPLFGGEPHSCTSLPASL